ncbi:MAG: type II toxin-antitoxin system RelE/ParE family toxin [Gammaproteobacteria bacterium]|nr:type II toxin-antitoxin system RelE/ParE family toxin [Gammaproteobacteria bacterium]
MAGYRFYPTAVQQQDEIWDYTVEQWGEQQAEKYIRELHQHLHNLASNRMLWRSLPNTLVVPQDLSISVYFSYFNKHIIFFRDLSDGMIGIMSILHETMDLPVRLSGDIRKINDE